MLPNAPSCSISITTTTVITTTIIMLARRQILGQYCPVLGVLIVKDCRQPSNPELPTHLTAKVEKGHTLGDHLRAQVAQREERQRDEEQAEPQASEHNRRYKV